jgi:4-amino-4-deoxy-L-arabinose transferase-like glycosyltransferase
LVLGAALHGVALFGELPEPDAALYASIARRMSETGDWVNLIAYNVDWLDKPHFPFWCTALSFKLFGVGVVSARLPALLFFGLGVFATWKLALLVHSRAVAQVAVLVLLVSQHVVMSTADTRAEPFLIGLLTLAVWLTVRASKAMKAGAPWFASLLGASVFTAAAMMTKGPFLALPVACAAVLPSLFRREPSFLARWLLAVPLVAVCLTPELYCLWRQFDAHPEKLVFERTGVSGLQWFFWDSQFGRFANSGPIRGQGDPTFFFHTVLWAFLPWSLLLYAAALARVRELRRRVPTGDPWSWAVVVPMVVLFSASRFQLPHYLNILFPFFAVIVAAFIVGLKPEGVWWAGNAQRLVLAGMAGFMGWLVVHFEAPHAVPVAVGLGLVALVVVAAPFESLVVRSVLGAAAVHLVHQLCFVPATLEYQVGGRAAALADTRPPMRTVMLDLSSHAFAFHLHERAMWWTDEDFRRELPNGPIRVLARQEKLDAWRAEGVTFTTLARWPTFHATTPTAAFLDAARRPGVLETWELAETR